MTLLVALPRTTYSQNSTTCEERFAIAKRIAQDAIDNARAAEARELEMKTQRNVAITELETCQTDRDQAAKGEADQKTRADTCEFKIHPLIVSNTFYEAKNKKLKKQRWIWAGAALVLGVLLGGGASFYVSTTR